jgi:hypothetical protein
MCCVIFVWWSSWQQYEVSNGKKNLKHYEENTNEEEQEISSMKKLYLQHNNLLHFLNKYLPVWSIY